MEIIGNNLHPKSLKNQLFTKAVDWLIDNNYVDNQKELAAVTKIQEPTLSNIRNDKKVVSDKTIRKLLDAFTGIFNPEYFRGGSIHMTMAELIESEKEKTIPSQDDPVAYLIEIYAERIRRVDDLRQSLKEELAEVRSIKEELKSTINKLQEISFRLTDMNHPSDLSIGMAADERKQY